MTLRDAAKIIGMNRSKGELKLMKTALSLHSHLNTAEEKERLKAVTLALAHWPSFSEVCDELRATLRRGIG